MGILARFFGKGDKDERPAELVANPEAKNPLGLQMLFAGALPVDFDAVAAAIRSYHHSMATARCELHLADERNFFGLAGWGKHVVRLVGISAPMPPAAVRACVAPAHYDPALKTRARAHSSHIMLYYVGYDASPHDQYVALAAAAGALAEFDAVVVLNETARTSLGAASLSAAGLQGDRLHELNDLPLLFLYCGFVKFDIEGVAGIWMRTYGAPHFGLPDLAALAAGHHEGELYFGIFETILGYLRDSGASLSAGHTMQLGNNQNIRVRRATRDEYFLESQHELLVIESVGSG
jgi:hypothetical protein